MPSLRLRRFVPTPRTSACIQASLVRVANCISKQPAATCKNISSFGNVCLCSDESVRLSLFQCTLDILRAILADQMMSDRQHDFFFATIFISTVFC